MLISTLSQVHIPLDVATKQPKGLAYVTFADPPKALAAYEALDKTSFQGRLLHILPAVDRKGKTDVDDGGRKKSLKEEREAKRKSGAGREFNWAVLYMNVRTIEYISLSHRAHYQQLIGGCSCLFRRR